MSAILKIKQLRQPAVRLTRKKKKKKKGTVSCICFASKAEARRFSLQLLFRFITFIPRPSTSQTQITEAPQISLFKGTT